MIENGHQNEEANMEGVKNMNNEAEEWLQQIINHKNSL